MLVIAFAKLLSSHLSAYCTDFAGYAVEQGALFLFLVCSCGQVSVSCVVINVRLSCDGSSVRGEGNFQSHFVLLSQNSGIGGGFFGYAAA